MSVQDFPENISQNANTFPWIRTITNYKFQVFFQLWASKFKFPDLISICLVAC